MKTDKISRFKNNDNPILSAMIHYINQCFTLHFGGFEPARVDACSSGVEHLDTVRAVL